MTGERPDDAQRPGDTAGSGDGTDGLEARRASDTDAPFPGLRSAADIFGAPRSADEWPSRRERREAIKAAQETGAPLPEPFTAPVDGLSQDDPDPASEPTPGEPADTGRGTPAAPAPDALSPADDAPALDDAATQAISMPEELAAPSQRTHPSSIQLPTAQSHRDVRAAEARAIDDERRRTDPTGSGRDDVDWLGRATGSGTGAVTVGEPMGRQPLGVEDALPSAAEPPSFTDLLRVQPSSEDGAPTAGRPFDWAVRDDRTGEVPTTLTSDAFATSALDASTLDTSALATGTWSLADEDDDEAEVVTGEVPVDETPEHDSATRATGVLGGTASGATTALPATTAFPAAPAGPGSAVAGSGSVPAAPAGTGSTPAGPGTPAGRGAADARADADAPTTRPAVPDAATGLPVERDRPATASGPATEETAAATSWSLSHEAEETPTVAFEPPRSAGATPWWAEPDDAVPPTAAPPLVEPAPGAYPAHLPPAVGQDFDGLLADGGDDRDTAHDPGPDDRDAAAAPAAAGPTPEGPDEIDQSEWTDRETSDTSAIKDLFGTAAVDQLGSSGYDPHDTGTAMLPTVRGSDAGGATGPATTGAFGAGAGAAAGDRAPRSAAPRSGAPTPGSQGLINQQFARLQGEGKRGKRLLFGGAVVLIVVLVVLVFLFAKWIMGNTVADHLTPPTSSPSAAAAQSAPPSSTPSAEAAAPAPTQAAGLPFATTPAAPGQHVWTDLAGGECLSPFTNAWAQTFTVVDCAAQHAAQLTARLPVQADAYPGADALAAQAAERCQTSEALDTGGAAALGDVQVQGSYAPDAATWQQGDTFISCFVSRSSGNPLTGSLAPTA